MQIYISQLKQIYKYRNLLVELVSRDLKVRYKRSIIGFAWSMLNPLLMMSILSIVFSNLFKTSLENYPVYVFCGLLFWNMFSAGTVSGMGSIVANGSLIRKIYVPIVVYPLSSVASALINFILSLVPLFILLFLLEAKFSVSLLYLPIAIGIITLFTTGLAFILATLNVFFRDTGHLFTVLLTGLMYLTPVMYPIEIIPPKYLTYYQLNPLYGLLELFRQPIYMGVFPSMHLSVAMFIFSFLVLIIGFILLINNKNKFINYL